MAMLYTFFYKDLRKKEIYKAILLPETKYNKVGFERRLLVGLVRGMCDRIS